MLQCTNFGVLAGHGSHEHLNSGTVKEPGRARFANDAGIGGLPNVSLVPAGQFFAWVEPQGPWSWPRVHMYAPRFPALKRNRDVV